MRSPARTTVRNGVWSAPQSPLVPVETAQGGRPGLYQRCSTRPLRASPSAWTRTTYAPGFTRTPESSSASQRTVSVLRPSFSTGVYMSGLSPPTRLRTRRPVSSSIRTVNAFASAGISTFSSTTPSGVAASGT